MALASAKVEVEQPNKEAKAKIILQLVFRMIPIAPTSPGLPLHAPSTFNFTQGKEGLFHNTNLIAEAFIV